MSFFISDAIAASTPAAGAPGNEMFSMFTLVAIFVLFYFMLIRPQSKRAKEQRELVANVKKGDEIITSSGILGKVTHLDDQFIKVTVAEGIELRMQRNAINSILPKGTLKSLS